MRALLISMMVCFLATPLAALEAGDAAPDFAFEQTWNMGSESSLSALRGNVVLVEYWATW
ncbi:MAG: hypothetical protein IT461_07245 [Planctomycetes bacterium]|nr:hypothetical protein [Planctomycetota bacterium]